MRDGAGYSIFLIPDGNIGLMLTGINFAAIRPSVKLVTAGWIALPFFFFLALPFAVDAGEPTERIRVAIDEGIQVLNESNNGGDVEKKEAVERLRKIVYPLFDFTEMAKRSLGSHWRRRTPEEKREFVTLFTNLLENSYADRIDLYNGQRVVFTREEVDDNYAMVESKIVNPKNEEFTVGYKLLRRDGGNWKIYDVVVENISLVNNYRSQFHRVIANTSYSDLVTKMREKTQ